MASEEPRQQHDTTDRGGKRASSAAPRCSAFSFKDMKGESEYNKSIPANDNPSHIPGESTVRSIMPSIEPPDRTATLQLPSTSQAISKTISPANDQVQSVKRELDVKPEPDVRPEAISSQGTALSDIPHYASSQETRSGSGTLKEEVTSSTEPITKETAATSALATQPREPVQVKETDLAHVREVARSADLAKLEAGTSTGLDILAKLQTPLEDAKQQHLLNTMEKLKKRDTSARTVVSVVGATGAGKSSLINAVLREEKLLPTNGMRACTAVITEISYNYDEDSDQPYRAEVEFITKEDWSSELSILFEELVDNKQLCSTYRDANTEAGVAYAKIRAVYPDLTHEMLVKSKRRELAGRDAVQEVLGTTRKMTFRTAGQLYKALQKYLDSKEKHLRSKVKKDGSELTFWPLIKVVRIYCRADALSTGLCIVDLPGIHDANAARSAVAMRYMAECTAVWLASPIKRAVDDKAAKDLLGRSSRTQLKMDGIYSNVTFICTFADVIEVNEIQDTLDDDDHIKEMQQRKAELVAAIEGKPAEITASEEKLEELNSECNALEGLFQAWEQISQQHEQGQQVYAPAPISTSPPRKRQRRTLRKKAIEEPHGQEPLTGDEISKKLQDVEEQCGSKIAEYNELTDRIQMAKDSLAKMKRETADLTTEILQFCMQLRNQYCKDAIRLDFAAGIREQDEEAAQEDDTTFDPSTSQRDYNEVARSLPVFAISSTAYQKLRTTDRQLRAEVEGFTSLDDTEIPALQTHAKSMTKTGRIMASKTFLNEFIQLLGTLQIFANISDTDILQSSQGGERTYEVKVLEKETANLKQRINLTSLELKSALFDVFRQNIKYSVAGSFATKRIEEVVGAWHAKEDEPVGHYNGLGLHFNTYRAICKRNGAKTASPKARDFNEELMGPFMTKISTHWEEVFTKTIPDSLDRFAIVFAEYIRQFQNEAMSRPGFENIRNTSLRMLEQQLPDHVASISDAIQGAKNAIGSEQRQAHRVFYPEVQKQMRHVYERCAIETGTGCFARMKDIMSVQTRSKRNTLYKRAYKAVARTVEKLIEAIVNEMINQLHGICDVMCKNYKAVISASQMIEASVVAREHLREVLTEVSAKFEAIANADADADADEKAMDTESAAVEAPRLAVKLATTPQIAVAEGE